MALLSWTVLNPNIQLLDTKKALHGQYLFRLHLYVPGATLLRDLSKDIDQQVVTRENRQRSTNWGGSWRLKPLDSDDVVMLKMIKSVLVSLPADMKSRIEDPGVQLYSTNEDQLLAIASQLAYKDNEHFVSIMRPQKGVSAETLLNGYVIRKREPKYKYRINFREGIVPSEVRQNVLQYLQQLDGVKIPHNVVRQLENPTLKHIWSSYIYANDPGIVTMLNLIYHNLVRNVEEFKTVDDDQ